MGDVRIGRKHPPCGQSQARVQECRGTREGKEGYSADLAFVQSTALTMASADQREKLRALAGLYRDFIQGVASPRVLLGIGWGRGDVSHQDGGGIVRCAFFKRCPDEGFTFGLQWFGCGKNGG